MDKQKRKSDRERLAKLEYEKRMAEIDLESYQDTVSGDNLTPTYVKYANKLNQNSKDFLLVKLDRLNIEIEYLDYVCELNKRP
jgi:hypothetical protein